MNKTVKNKTDEEKRLAIIKTAKRGRRKIEHRKDKDLHNSELLFADWTRLVSFVPLLRLFLDPIFRFLTEKMDYIRVICRLTGRRG